MGKRIVKFTAILLTHRYPFLQLSPVSPMKPLIFLFPLLAASALVVLSGCKTFETGVNQKVTVISFPTGASVSVDGQVQGATPLDLQFPRKLSQTLTLRKSGYYDHSADIFPIRNAAGNGFVRFGLAEDLGYYFDLVPNPVEIQMLPAVVPLSRGPDPFNEMATKVMATDARRETGEISPVEHRYIVERLIEFYTK